MSVAVIIIFTYISIMITARSVSSDKDSAKKALKTVLALDSAGTVSHLFPVYYNRKNTIHDDWKQLFSLHKSEIFKLSYCSYSAALPESSDLWYER